MFVKPTKLQEVRMRKICYGSLLDKPIWKTKRYQVGADSTSKQGIKFKYRIYPRIGRTFFKEKKRSKFGVRLIRGYKSFELINMQNFPTHTESTKLLKA